MTRARAPLASYYFKIVVRPHPAAAIANQRNSFFSLAELPSHCQRQHSATPTANYFLLVVYAQLLLAMSEM